MFLLKLFGTVSIEGPSGVVTGKAARRHALALLSLLALSHSRRLSRDKLVGYLWPESGSTDARNLLNQSVHALRRALGEEAIRSEGDELALGPDAVTCDVWQFEEALASGDAEWAVDLYVGPFVDGFFLADSVEFERWAAGERERLRRGYLKALEELAETAMVAGDLKAAAEWWRRLAAEEPYNSNTTLRFMQTLESAGDRAGAIREAEAHAKRLREDLDAAPNPAVLALADRMRTQPIGSAPAPGSPERPSPGEPAASRPERPVAARRSWRRAAIVGAGLALLVFASWAVMNPLERDAQEIRSLAVIPLANLTGDSAQDYFVAGMHDALVTELGQIATLTVISRQSMLRYQDSEQPLPAIARALGVEALVEGSVFLAGDSVRITVQLVRAEPEEHLWASTYHGALRDALALQGEVARAIAQAIGARVTPAVETRLASQWAVDPEAQEAYLKGLYQLELQATAGGAPAGTGSSERLEEQRGAISYLEEAIALDPEWAAAHAKLALAYHFVAAGAAGWDMEAEFYTKAKEAALHALELDDTEARAHASLGFVLLHYDWAWAEAEREIRHALELEPNANHWTYAIYLSAALRHDEALTHYRQAEERNPLLPGIKWQAAYVYSCAGRHDEAIAELEQLRTRLGDNVVGLRLDLGLEYLSSGRHAEGIAELKTAVDLGDGDPVSVAGLAYGYARAGRLDEALALMPVQELRSDDWLRLGPALYAALGETDRAIASVEAAFNADARGWAPHFRCSWTYQELQNEPRFQEMMGRIGFPD